MEPHSIWSTIAENISGVFIAFGTIIGAVVGWAAAKARLNFDTAQIHKEESEKRLISMAEIRKEQEAVNIAQIKMITDRFQILIDGYEKRVDDLTQEVRGLRDEVHRLRFFIDERMLGVPHASAAPPQS